MNHNWLVMFDNEDREEEAVAEDNNGVNSIDDDEEDFLAVEWSVVWCGVVW